MTCAACDDCTPDKWYLHVTVKPPKQWGFFDIQRALEADITKIGMRPVVVTNHFRDGRKPYKELIPTKHVSGSEADASREIFRMGTLLNNSGWRVKRLKIEGDARTVHNGRALYYETHIKGVMHDRFPVSTNAKGERIATIRGYAYSHVKLIADGYAVDPRIEAAVLDTAPELDHEWINQ